MRMKPYLFAVVLVAALGFSGCAHYQERPLSAEKVTADFGHRTLADPGLRLFIETNLQRTLPEWPPAVWDFTNLVFVALYNHPDLEVARARWAVAQAGGKTAAERPNPTVGVAPAYNTTTPTPSPWLVVPALDLPIETAHKRGYRMTLATHLSEAARWNLATVAWQVRGGLRNTLVALYAASESERLLKEQQAIQAENVRLLEQQQAAGAISAFELTQARLAANSTRLALRDAERQSAETQVMLADALGVPVAALEHLSISTAGVNDLSNDIPEAQARRQALLHRSDIRGALAEYAASQAALQLEIAKQYPDIHLNSPYEFDQGDNKWGLGVSVTLPVLNQNKGPIAEAEARRAESAATFYALQARVVAEIERAVAAYRLSLLKRADTDAMQANLLKQEKSARGMLEAGEISKSDLAALRLQLSAVALARLDAITKSLHARAQLEDALQSPLGLPPSVWQNAPRVSATQNR